MAPKSENAGEQDIKLAIAEGDWANQIAAVLILSLFCCWDLIPEQKDETGEEQ